MHEGYKKENKDHIRKDKSRKIFEYMYQITGRRHFRHCMKQGQLGQLHATC